MLIKNIIFDFGGVLLDVDYFATEKAFEQLGIPNFGPMFSQASQSTLFDQLEIGTITPEAFCEQFREKTSSKLTDEQITQAWNAMLGSMPQERVQLLIDLKEKYRIFAFSNTNAIHMKAFTKTLKEENGINDFPAMFEKAYFSHQLGMRKPHPEGFECIISENSLIPAETLFIDDTARHVEGAKKVGIQGHFLDLSKENIIDYFNNKG